MIRKVRVENYKSIPNLALDLGRVTVLIGANGSGKSNILEAIALASAAAQNKLDNEFLISRGIRVTETRFMRLGVRQALPRPAKSSRFRSRKTASRPLRRFARPANPSRSRLRETTKSHSIANYSRTKRRPIPNGSSCLDT